MSAFWSRILIAVAGLPIVLGLVWLGGWWLFGLAAAAVVVALHEFAGMTRPLRPLMPAALRRRPARALRRRGGRPRLGARRASSSTFALALLLRLVADVRQAGDDRDRDDRPRRGLDRRRALAPAAPARHPDARAARRLRRPARGLGRRHGRVLHRAPDRPPQADPGDLARQDVGGLLRRQRRDDPRRLLRALRRPQGLPLRLAGARPRRRAGARRAGRRPVRVGGQAGHEREGQRAACSAGHGGVLDRLDAFLFALPAAYWLLRGFGVA